ncbi:hypothetical protein M9H77_19130 [Catharanthus roseus]|uniref:Uncharacterized protein n=1 Tax=Catharanthus roseus TaxID=4058 RepID=A0ACC0B9J9_CATRO|nr:hypothetical protein M9H77_19130 [Catharanthus roseus]
MAFTTQLGLQANGIYEFDLLEYLSSSEHIFLLGNFLNLMSNCVDGPFKVVAKYTIISCRQNFGYVGLVKYDINKVQLDIISPPLTSTPNEYDSVIFDEKQYHRFLPKFCLALYPCINKSYVIRNKKLNKTTDSMNMKLNVEEHEQIIASASHDQGTKRKYNIFFEDDLLNTLSEDQTSQKKQKSGYHRRCLLLLLLPPSFATEVKGNYVVLHHILKCSMSVTDILMIIRQIMNRKRRGFAIEKIDKIGTKGHIFTFLRVTCPEINKRIRMWDYDASDVCGEMFKCQELQGEKIAPQKE